LNLRIVVPAPDNEPRQLGTKLNKVDGAERRATAGGPPKFVWRIDVRQFGRNRAERAIRANANDPILTPMRATAHYFELVSGHRMEWVSDAYIGARRTHMVCS
jgi:hypothetical protein